MLFNCKTQSNQFIGLNDECFLNQSLPVPGCSNVTTEGDAILPKFANISQLPSLKKEEEYNPIYISPTEIFPAAHEKNHSFCCIQGEHQFKTRSNSMCSLSIGASKAPSYSNWFLNNDSFFNNENGHPNQSFQDARMIQKVKRRKGRRACLACKKSHVVCEGGYPCLRCIKRKIEHFCTVEAVEALEIQSRKVVKGKLLQNEFEIPKIPDIMLPMTPIVSPNPEQSFSTKFDHMISLPNNNLQNFAVSENLFSHFKSDTSYNELFNYNLSQFASTELQPDHKSIFSRLIQFVTLKCSQSNLEYRNLQDKHLLDEYKLNLLIPYNTCSRLSNLVELVTTKMQSSESPTTAAYIKSAIAIIDTRLVNMTLLNLLRHEELFNSLFALANQIFMNNSIPAAVWRLSGEGCSFSDEFVMLIGNPINRNSVNFYSYFHPSSTAQLWAHLMDSINRPDDFTFTMDCLLKTNASSSDWIKCTLHFIVLFDPLKIPCTCVGIFLPSLN